MRVACCYLQCFDIYARHMFVEISPKIVDQFSSITHIFILLSSFLRNLISVTLSSMPFSTWKCYLLVYSLWHQKLTTLAVCSNPNISESWSTEKLCMCKVQHGTILSPLLLQSEQKEKYNQQDSRVTCRKIKHLKYYLIEMYGLLYNEECKQFYISNSLNKQSFITH